MTAGEERTGGQGRHTQRTKRRRGRRSRGRRPRRRRIQIPHVERFRTGGRAPGGRSAGGGRSSGRHVPRLRSREKRDRLVTPQQRVRRELGDPKGAKHRHRGNRGNRRNPGGRPQIPHVHGGTRRGRSQGRGRREDGRHPDAGVQTFPAVEIRGRAVVHEGRAGWRGRALVHGVREWRRGRAAIDVAGRNRLRAACAAGATAAQGLQTFGRDPQSRRPRRQRVLFVCRRVRGRPKPIGDLLQKRVLRRLHVRHACVRLRPFGGTPCIGAWWGFGFWVGIHVVGGGMDGLREDGRVLGSCRQRVAPEPTVRGGCTLRNRLLRRASADAPHLDQMLYAGHAAELLLDDGVPWIPRHGRKKGWTPGKVLPLYPHKTHARP